MARSRLDRLIGFLGPDRTLPERAALFAAAAVVGPSFEPGLQRRTSVQQAVATGMISAATLGAVTLAMSSVESLGRIATRDRASRSSDRTRLIISVGTNAVAAAAGLGLARVLPPREGETFRRGLLRTVADRTGRTALLTTALAASVGTTDYLSRRPGTTWVGRIPIALPAGTAYAAYTIQQVRRRAAAMGDQTIAGVSPGRSVGMALGVAAGVLALQSGERAIAHAVGSGVARVAPSYERIAMPIGHLVSLGLLGAGAVAGYEYLTRRVEDGGAAIEPAYRATGASHHVSGGPSSLIEFESLSREGRRFVNMALTGEEIAEVMGAPAIAEPVRAFVGLASAQYPEDRVALLMDELVRLGAFEREILVFASPTGSGYINYVMAEAVEYLSRGNSAIVTMQYSLLPSFLSLDRTRLAVEQNRLMMNAITGYLRGMPVDKRPRFVLFGESLGAQTMQDVYAHRPVDAMERDFVSGSLFVGTPAATRFAKAWRLDPERMDPQGHVVEVDNFGQVLALPAEQRRRLRHYLVSHDDDPIPKFAPTLLVRRPVWLGDPQTRPRGVPRSTQWRPATTFILTGVDLLNAMDVVPGRFTRRGHDYRTDLGRFTLQAFGLSASPQQLRHMEQALRAREVRWAEQRVVSEQLARARESILREVRTWGSTLEDSGVDASSILRALGSTTQR